MAKDPRFLRKKELAEAVTFWSAALGLHRWCIVQIIEEPPHGEEDEIALMSVSRSQYYDDAILYVHPWCVGQGDLGVQAIESHLASKGFFERKVVHELLHLTTRDTVMQSNDLDGYLHRDVLEQFERTRKRHEEQFVDRLATSLQEQFGLFREGV